MEWGPPVFDNYTAQTPVEKAIMDRRDHLETELKTLVQKVKESEAIISKCTPVINKLKEEIEELNKAL